MKQLRRVLLVAFLLLACGVQADEIRVWKSADGKSTITAIMIEVKGGKVVLRKTDGKKVTVPIDMLCDEDRQYLADLASAGTSSAKATSAPATSQSPGYEQGRIVGPIVAGSDAHYLFYIPKSMKPGRKAPLLFFTHSGGGSSYLLENILEGAEINGWILAISIESRNDSGVEKNMESSKGAVRHILKTLPVDGKRLYFTGNSGGAAMAFYNYDNLGGYGLMPSIGYLPSGLSAPRGDCFVINGTYDYNRYASASVRKEIGKTAIHRFHEGGHQDAPGWIMVEGMVWLEGRHLAKYGKKHPDAQLDYENGMLAWIETLQAREPHRAYYWAVFLRDELTLSKESADRVNALVAKLGSDSKNRLYVEALQEIDEFSGKVLAGFGSGSLFNHSDPQIVSACEKMLKKYSEVPAVAALLTSFCRKSSPQ